MAKYDHLLASQEFDQNPYPVYHLLREAAPVYRSDAWGCWVLTRYDEVVGTLRDHGHFTSTGRLTSVMRRDLTDLQWEQLQPLVRHYNTGLINVDPPDHTRLRSLVHKAFSPAVIEGMRQIVQQMVDGILDQVQHRGEIDVLRDLAYPLPVMVIADLLGIPREDSDRLKSWSATTLEFMATPRPSPEVLFRSQNALLGLRAYLYEAIQQRRNTPRQDLIGLLVAVEEAGDRLSEEEMLSTCATLLIAGHETTTNLIASGLYTLLRHPDQLQRLRAASQGDAALMRSAVEEMLRFEGPFQRARRIATADVEVGGQLVRRGELVLQLLGAANRDPAQFPNPDRFDIARQPNKHVAFGFGVHFCLGAALARLEAPIAIGSLLARFPDLRLASADFTWRNTLLRGLTALPVQLR